MENATYVTLTRQSGLAREMQVIANNIANQATTGFRQEGVIFSEYVKRLDNAASLSMANGNVGNTSMLQGELRQTGAPLDLAIEGPGFFLVETAAGPRLTRAGAFTPNALGELVAMDGNRVLDVGGAPVFLPPGAGDLSVGADGTISRNGQPLARLGVVEPADPLGLVREGGQRFDAPEGFAQSENGRVLQGFLEQSNVDSIGQVARMIEVQRAYEMGQSFLDREDERIRNMIKTVIR